MVEVETVDDGETEAPGRHRMLFWRSVLMEGNLQTGYAWTALDLIHQRRRRMPIPAVRAEQHHAVAFAAILIIKVPFAALIQADHRLDPAGTEKVRPLIGKAQVRLDDAPAERFQIDHAGIAGKLPPQPGAAIGLNALHRLGMYGPVVESAAASGFTGDVPPP